MGVVDHLGLKIPQPIAPSWFHVYCDLTFGATLLFLNEKIGK
jgi:hypothetical protein